MAMLPESDKEKSSADIPDRKDTDYGKGGLKLIVFVDLLACIIRGVRTPDRDQQNQD